MRKIRLLQIGEGNNSVIHRVSSALTRLQDVYEFMFFDDVIIPAKGDALADGTYAAQYLEQRVTDYMLRNRYSEYPIAICHVAFPEEVISSSDARMALISTYEHQRFCQRSLFDLLKYLVASALIDTNITIECHDETRGCPSDFCDNLADVNVGMANAEFCGPCRDVILRAVEAERIGIREVVAISRILDNVAGRKLCFVLMPFAAEYGPVYQAIRSVAVDAGYTCIRSDGVFEARTIIQLIYEQIGRAEVIVADLTGRNPNVFYELGYAHAQSRTTVLITQRADDVPFDLRHRQYVQYEAATVSACLPALIRAYFR